LVSGLATKNHLLVDRFDTNAIEIEISFCRIISQSKKIIMVKRTKHALSRLL